MVKEGEMMKMRVCFKYVDLVAHGYTAYFSVEDRIGLRLRQSGNQI